MSGEESILETLRSLLGPSEDYEAFDTDIIVHANSAFARLCELGVGPSEPFHIEDDSATWQDFSTENPSWQVMRFVYMYVKKIFDPPANATIMQAIDHELDKLEWTMCSDAEVGY